MGCPLEMSLRLVMPNAQQAIRVAMKHKRASIEVGGVLTISVYQRSSAV
jgi:hypothetical protein